MQVLVFIVGLSKSFSCHWCLYRNFVVENRKFGGRHRPFLANSVYFCNCILRTVSQYELRWGCICNERRLLTLIIDCIKSGGPESWSRIW